MDARLRLRTGPGDPSVKCVVLLSGGVDSAVALALKVAQYGADEVVALSVNYGQRHRRELDAAAELAEFYGVHHANAITRLPGTSSLTSEDGRLEGAPTVVPGRNAVLLALAVSLAQSLGAGEVVIACHTGDHGVYPDCRPEFVRAFSRVSEIAYRVRAHGLFLSYSKTEIVSMGRKLGVPLGLTWSCYAGGEEPCGECGACRERASAFGMEQVS